jgi:uncharacterized phage protein (TIGR02216 family)
VIGFGLGVLGLAPEAFWAMTPRELAAAIKARLPRQGSHPPGRIELSELMQRFPDL